MLSAKILRFQVAARFTMNRNVKELRDKIDFLLQQPSSVWPRHFWLQEQGRITQNALVFLFWWTAGENGNQIREGDGCSQAVHLTLSILDLWKFPYLTEPVEAQVGTMLWNRSRFPPSKLSCSNCKTFRLNHAHKIQFDHAHKIRATALNIKGGRWQCVKWPCPCCVLFH